MPGYTRGDFAAEYGFCPHIPGTSERLARYRNPEVFGTDAAVTLRLPYHPLRERKSAAQRVDTFLNEYSVTKADAVVIFGCGFGWFGEKLREATGCAVVGIEISDYVHSVKHLSPDDDLIAAIKASGWDPDTGVGLMLFNWFTDPTPRAQIPLLAEYLDTDASLARVRDALGSTPTYIVTEDVWTILSAQEHVEYNQRFAALGGTVVHYFDGRVY